MIHVVLFEIQIITGEEPRGGNLLFWSCQAISFLKLGVYHPLSEELHQVAHGFISLFTILSREVLFFFSKHAEAGKHFV